MDITASAQHGLIAGESIPGRIHFSPGGVARNAAENLARLGNATRLIAVVGRDRQGRELIAATRKAGVDTRACLALPGYRTACYLSLHGPDGEMALAVNDMDSLQALTPARLVAQRPRLRHAAALLLDCNLSNELLDWVFSQESGAPIFVDGVSAFKVLRLKPWLTRIHTLKVNRAEASALTGRRIESLAQARAVAAWFVRQGVKQVALSLGRKGICWHDAQGDHGLAVATVATVAPVVNATGAGDALLAGLLHAYLAGDRLAQAIEFASACAAMTLSSPAANHPGLSQAAVRQWMGKPEHPSTGISDGQGSRSSRKPRSTTPSIGKAAKSAP